MKTRILLAALALAALPGLALAFGCQDRTQITASSCAEGQVWDGVAGTCVDKPTS
ncbi:MAG: hypothetical protein IAE87_20860 [Rhodobacteraceae bacterium]|nr:hypothetical protein [Paracoccaceae bacterium]